MNTFKSRLKSGNRNQSTQAGVALVTALVLLIVITVLGLAAVRSATIQQRLSGNFYDRELAFQSAEAALRAAASTLTAIDTAEKAAPGTNADINYCNGAATCLLNPFTNPPAGVTQTVATGTGDDSFTIAGNAGSQPQYIIQNMGQGTAAAVNPSSPNCAQSANAGQYGGGNSCDTVQATPGAAPTYYRITARSGDPAAAANDNRAVVTLQAIYRQ